MDNLRFFIQTFGCQMNDHDSTVLAHLQMTLLRERMNP